MTQWLAAGNSGIQIHGLPGRRADDLAQAVGRIPLIPILIARKHLQPTTRVREVDDPTPDVGIQIPCAVALDVTDRLRRRRSAVDSQVIVVGQTPTTDGAVSTGQPCEPPGSDPEFRGEFDDIGPDVFVRQL